MLETHLRRVLRASRINPNFLIRPELFPKTSTARRNASRRLFGLNSFGRPYQHVRWPELRHHLDRGYKFYHAAYMRIWRRNSRRHRKFTEEPSLLNMLRPPQKPSQKTHHRKHGCYIGKHPVLQA